MPDVVDPFEEFRKKKEAAKQGTAKADEAAKVVIPPEALEGRPKGFTSHRYDFGKGDEGAATEQKPKGFKPTNVAEGPKEGLAPLPKPRGFNTARIVKKKG